MLKNVAGQTFHVIAFNALGRVSGEAANIIADLAIDEGTRTALTDTTPTEIGTTGEYVFTLTQAETNGFKLSFSPTCSTLGVQVLGVPSNVIYTNGDVSSISGSALSYLDAKFASTLGYIVVQQTTLVIDGFPSYLRKKDARSIENGKAIHLRLYAEDDTEYTTPLLGVGSLLFVDAESVEFAITLIDAETPEVSFAIEWVEGGGDGYFLVEYEEDALDAATTFVSGALKYHQWGVKVKWPTAAHAVTVMEGTTKVYNPIVL
jgi:hypothetical protein